MVFNSEIADFCVSPFNEIVSRPQSSSSSLNWQFVPKCDFNFWFVLTFRFEIANKIRRSRKIGYRIVEYFYFEPVTNIRRPTPNWWDRVCTSTTILTRITITKNQIYLFWGTLTYKSQKSVFWASTVKPKSVQDNLILKKLEWILSNMRLYRTLFWWALRL